MLLVLPNGGYSGRDLGGQQGLVTSTCSYEFGQRLVGQACTECELQTLSGALQLYSQASRATEQTRCSGCGVRYLLKA